MEITLAEQTSCFLYSCLFGACMSLVYDFFRAVRVIFHFGKVATFFEDVIYFFALGVVTFGFVIVVNDGELRGYIFLGAFLGWIIYHLSVGNITIRALCWAMGMFHRFLRFLWRRVFAPMFRPWKKLLQKRKPKAKKCEKRPKKHLQKRKKLLQDKK